MIYQLNASGKYFAFKEQLKHAVVKIVREKYLQTANFGNKDELQVKHNTFVIIPLKNLTLPKRDQSARTVFVSILREIHIS